MIGQNKFTILEDGPTQQDQPESDEMLKYRVQTAKGQPDILGFGLSWMNLEKLKEGQPIIIQGKELGINEDVIIHAGPTEDIMATVLQKQGVQGIIQDKASQEDERH